MVTQSQLLQIGLDFKALFLACSGIFENKKFEISYDFLSELLYILIIVLVIIGGPAEICFKIN